MLQEKFGPTVVNSLRKPNPSPPPRCHRDDCKPCLHGIKDIKCFTNNIGYRILCNRSPCSDKLVMTQQQLQTDKLRLQLDKLNIDSSKPAIYEGETWRSSYSRSKSHWSCYTTESGQSRSFMWHHTVESHQSIIGPNRGAQDYMMVITGTFKSSISRLVDEGRRQSVMEEYQARKVITVLNSKTDFIQPIEHNSQQSQKQ